MNLNQGTPVGQVNSVPKSQSAFAAVNPPMHPLRAGVMPPEGTTLSVEQWQQVMKPQTAEIPPMGELPQAWAVASPPARDNYTVADVVNGLLTREWQGRDATASGVVTVRVPNFWTPKSVLSVPPSLTNKLGMYLSAQWAMLFNGSDYARRKNRWALVTTRGTVLILTGVTLQDRPANPSDFPRCVVGGLTTYEADQMAIGANEPRCKFALVPHEWTIPVRRADTVEPEVMTETSSPHRQRGGRGKGGSSQEPVAAEGTVSE